MAEVRSNLTARTHFGYGKCASRRAARLVCLAPTRPQAHHWGRLYKVRMKTGTKHPYLDHPPPLPAMLMPSLPLVALSSDLVQRMFYGASSGRAVRTVLPGASYSADFVPAACARRSQGGLFDTVLPASESSWETSVDELPLFPSEKRF